MGLLIHWRGILRELASCFLPTRYSTRRWLQMSPQYCDCRVALLAVFAIRLRTPNSRALSRVPVEPAMLALNVLHVVNHLARQIQALLQLLLQILNTCVSMPPSRPSLALLSSATARDARTRRGHNPRHSLETACAHARKPPGVHTATASAMHVPGVAFRAQRRIEPAPPPSPVHPPGSATTRAPPSTRVPAPRAGTGCCCCCA